MILVWFGPVFDEARYTVLDCVVVGGDADHIFFWGFPDLEARLFLKTSRANRWAFSIFRCSFSGRCFVQTF